MPVELKRPNEVIYAILHIFPYIHPHLRLCAVSISNVARGDARSWTCPNCNVGWVIRCTVPS